MERIAWGASEQSYIAGAEQCPDRAIAEDVLGPELELEQVAAAQSASSTGAADALGQAHSVAAPSNRDGDGRVEIWRDDHRGRRSKIGERLRQAVEHAGVQVLFEQCLVSEARERLILLRGASQTRRARECLASNARRTV